MNQRKKVTFSVIICCYNSEKYLEESINSITEQTLDDWELVIINDGSTDGTEKIIKSFIQKDFNINYIYQENKGFACARNKALAAAEGEWIVILDHDDIAVPRRLEYQLSQINKNPNSKLFFGDALCFGSGVKEYMRFDISRNIDKFDPCHLDLSKKNAYQNLYQYGCFIVSSTVTFNKLAAVEVGGFNQDYKFVADYDFFLKFALKYDLYCTKEIISKWRAHKDQSTNELRKELFKELSLIYFRAYRSNQLNFSSKCKVLKNHLYSHLNYFRNN
ncbi:MAG: glycosyltransferase family 2 protein [Pseudomonadota bacterium]|nr:glycosyltransferase family 2 protein [Pseudomonadota bacterium]